MERRIRRSCGLKSVNQQICLRHWHTARRHYLQPAIANASANVTIACFTSTTPARRESVAGAACSYAGIGLRLQRTQLASARIDKKASYISSGLSIVVKAGMRSPPLQTRSAPDSGRMKRNGSHQLAGRISIEKRASVDRTDQLSDGHLGSSPE